jgi:hypothetical protein
MNLAIFHNDFAHRQSSPCSNKDVHCAHAHLDCKTNRVQLIAELASKATGSTLNGVLRKSRMNFKSF